MGKKEKDKKKALTFGGSGERRIMEDFGGRVLVKGSHLFKEKR